MNILYHPLYIPTNKKRMQIKSKIFISLSESEDLVLTYNVWWLDNYIKYKHNINFGDPYKKINLILRSKVKG